MLNSNTNIFLCCKKSTGKISGKSQWEKTELFTKLLGWLGAGGRLVQRKVTAMMVKHGDKDKRSRDQF